MSARTIRGPILTEAQIEKRRAALQRGLASARMGMPGLQVDAVLHDALCRGELTHAELMTVILERHREEKPSAFARPAERVGTMSLADIRKDGRLGGTA